MEPNMDEKISNSLLKQIFSYLNYKDLVRVRLVSKRFNVIAEDILNNSLIAMNEKLMKSLDRLNVILHQRDVNQNALRYFKIMNYLRSEIDLIIAVTFVYMNEGLYSFGGACILDFYEKFLKLSYKDIENNFEYITIFHMVESFLNNFDDKVEPYIIDNHREFSNSWFGVKLVNLLDCSLDLNCKIELSESHSNCVILDGKYNGEELHILENMVIGKKEMNTDKEKRLFLQSIRNNIRWSNLLYCIERSSGELSQTCLSPGLHTNLRNSSIYEKRVTKQWEDGEPGVCYKVNIKCHRHFLPLRANSILKNKQKNSGTKRNLDLNLEKSVKENSEIFDLNLLMKVRTRDDDGDITEKVIKLFNVGNSCMITEHIKRNNVEL